MTCKPPKGFADYLCVSEVSRMADTQFRSLFFLCVFYFHGGRGRGEGGGDPPRPP